VFGVGGDEGLVAPQRLPEGGFGHPPEPAIEAWVPEPPAELGQSRSRRQLTEQGVAPHPARVVGEVEALLREGRTDRLCRHLTVSEREGDALAEEGIDPGSVAREEHAFPPFSRAE
jgi:hypothetical protein